MAPEPILQIPDLDICKAEDLHLQILEQVLSEDTQRLIREEVGERCAICFAVSPPSTGGRALPLLNRREAKYAIALTVIPADFSVDCQDNGLWLCSHCIPMMISCGTMMATSFFLPVALLNYILKFRSEEPPKSHIPFYEVMRRLESQPSLDTAASAVLGQYKLLSVDPETVHLVYPHLPPFIANQARDGPSFVYDTRNANSLTPSFNDDQPRNQMWKIHRPPGVMFAFLSTHLSTVIYAVQDGDYMPPEECLKYASLFCELKEQFHSRSLPSTGEMKRDPLDGSSGWKSHKF
ncbi:hypothetical protein VNI00_004943 [Paramarasmius palmivorus]|uniref:Uncharacterized protein n=1 Tax=Paramarasmius palmivorus TaxID=297713 RepID=A0AAW0DL61_9AGAR